MKNLIHKFLMLFPLYREHHNALLEVISENESLKKRVDADEASFNNKMKSAEDYFENRLRLLEEECALKIKRSEEKLQQEISVVKNNWEDLKRSEIIAALALEAKGK